MTTKQLPDKPSDLIALALADLEKIEKDEKYSVDMGTWHAPSHGKCYVCFAGSVMAKTMETDPKEATEPCRAAGADAATIDKLLALDSFRRGNVFEGLWRMRIRQRYYIRTEVRVTPYSASPKSFKEDMQEIVDHLRKWGL